MAKTYVIRDAMPEDVPQVLSLCRAMFEESRYRDLFWDEQKLGDRLVRWFANANVLFVLGEADDKLAGFIGGTITDWIFSSQRQAADLLFFVHPDHRRSTLSRALVRRYLRWAKAQGAVEATISTSTGVRPQATAAFLERQGFETCGGVFKQRLS